MTHTSTDPDRAEFEMWARKCCYDIERVDGAIQYTSNLTEQVWWAWQAARRAPAVPQGWKLAPEVPTRKMYEETWETKQYVAFDRFVDDYEAMLAAAPQPPEATVNHSLTVDSAQLDDINVVDMAQAVDLKEAAPVQLPDCVGAVMGGVDEAEVTWRGGWPPIAGTKLYTEQQVRQIISTLQK